MDERKRARISFNPLALFQAASEQYRAAVASMVVGTVSSLGLIYLSPILQVGTLNQPKALFPLTNPGIVSIPLSLIVAISASCLTGDRPAIEKLDELEQRKSQIYQVTYESQISRYTI